MPTYQAFSCPQCTAPLPHGAEELTCPYCGARLKLDPPEEQLTGDELAMRGVRFYNADQPGQAITDLEKALTRAHPNNTTESILSVLGLCFNEVGNYEKGIEYQQRAVAQNPAFYKGWVNMGVSYRKNGQLDKAEECYERAIQLNPNYAELHSSLGVLHIFRDQPEKALAPLQRAIRLDPTVGSFYGNLALAYAMLGRFDEAETALKGSIFRGYERHETVRQRIEALKALAQK